MLESVTDSKCTCGYLERAAREPSNPIVFDDSSGMYRITYQEAESDGKSMLVIYHCPWCGGVAPQSLPKLQFHVISNAEEQRLAELLAPLGSIQNALDRFGEPDLDTHTVTRSPSDQLQGRPPITDFHREVVYEQLSNVANVRITERKDGSVFWHLEAKSIGL